MGKFNYNDQKFTIESYDDQKPFASFLPGVAGVNGIPMWVYYTNRGQGIAGFGIENKDGAIFDFVPANVAYKRTELQGYRTFIKCDGKVHEIFSSMSDDVFTRRMIIETNGVAFEEINETLNIKVTAKYVTVTNKNYPGLIRYVTIENLDNVEKTLEIVDGIATLWPYKNENFVTKNLANLAVAWFEVYNAEKHLPFFRNRSTTNDSASVGTVEAGHFYASYIKGQKKPIDVIYDPELIFGRNTSLLKARKFEQTTTEQLKITEQVSANKLPCAFSLLEVTLKDTIEFTSVVGKLSKIELLDTLENEFSYDYFKSLEVAAFDLGDSLIKDVKGKTNYPIFDAYVQQSYLDNLLRGGYPLIFEGKEGPVVYHVYSRIHGDMEREYNDFYVEPAYYSHGVGNFRDVNQNRRNDVFVVKEAGLFNVKQFVELLQIDGQNPLTIKGSTLKISIEDMHKLMNYVKTKKELIEPIMSKAFTPGELLTTIEDYDVELTITSEVFMKEVFKCSSQENQAAYGHGFWVDHWTYNMDLIDNYLNVFPDKVTELLFDEPLKYFQSMDVVLPRKDKYIINDDGKVRQYDAIYRDQERLEALGIDASDTNWMKTKSGDVFESNMFVKLFTLVMNKITNLDPSGIGVMMNSDKPGWNDAMNGLPGLFGSGSSEVVELNRVVNFLKDNIKKSPQPIELTSALYSLTVEYNRLLSNHLNADESELLFWEHVQDIKEEFVKNVSLTVSDETLTLKTESIENILNKISLKIDDAISKAIQMGDGIIPSYLVHEAEVFEELGTTHPVNGLKNVKVMKWSCRALPLYLEAPARYLKQIDSTENAKKMYDRIKTSGMYDEKLKMYITSESLEEETLEIGRARAFTAGWLERESVFMHMSYKYLLGLLKSGLHNEFFDAVKTALPPFMDPEVYGRSTLENSSFIASSRNPDVSNHGRGFVSRLTGTTSEMITMWIHMMTGTHIFRFDEELVFNLEPVLSSDYFDENNEVHAMIFGDTKIVYKNPMKHSTFGEDAVQPVSYTLTYKDGRKNVLMQVKGCDALDVRNGEIALIEVLLG